MAKRNSMSTARRSRNRNALAPADSGNTETHQSCIGPTAKPQSGDEGLPEIIRAERARLMRAEAVLGCVAFTALYQDWLKDAPNMPSLEDAVRAAGDLVR